jgi:hypothetical protein
MDIYIKINKQRNTIESDGQAATRGDKYMNNINWEPKGKRPLEKRQKCTSG